ncbi:MAG TPA: YihY/virulence factor BrkB family protein [Anaerolineae bacterium]|nr:YihY/virulence factor BrkB family protein [Anaerolineae bacterium]
MRKLRALGELLKETFKEWQEDKASRLAAALSYYTILSLPPILLIVVAAVGLVLGRQGVEDAIVEQASGLIGEEAGELVAEMAAGAFADTGSGILATLLGVGALLFSATGAFVQLQQALNTIWEVTPGPDRGIMETIKARGLSFGMLLVVAFLLLVSLVISAGLSAAGKYLEGLLPGMLPVAQVLSLLLSFGVITLLFALIYKYLPDVEIDWSEVWVGAAVTALLFTLGEFLIGLYLGRSSTASAYGAAGALVLLLLWIYYSAQILFFGAEFTQVYARKHGSRLVPAEYAVRVSEMARAQQGIPHREVVELAAKAKDEPPPIRPDKGPPALPPPPPRASLSTLKRLVPGVLAFAAGILAGVVVGTRDEDDE